MRLYGCDRPDVRFGMLLHDITDIVKDTGFKVFASVAQSGGVVKAINVKGAGDWSRGEVEKLASIAEAKQLVDGCPQITSINLGNTKSKDEQRPDARKISRQIFVTAAEEEDIRELVGRGVEVEIRALADDPKVDALSAL